MKIGILTLSASDNCGSLLQTYALQKYLESQGHEIEIINFINTAARKMYRIFHPSYIKIPKKLIGQLIHFQELKNQKKSYDAFRKQLNLTTEIYVTENALADIDGKYNAIVVGSDQVWSVNMRDFDNSYFLEWCSKSKKISYAASLGKKNENTRAVFERKKQILESFDGISVREISSKQLLQQIIDKEINVSVDPTLLLSSKQWNDIIDKSIIIPDQDYIFYYSYNYENEEKNSMVAKFAKEQRLPVYVINASRWVDGRDNKYQFKRIKIDGPMAFLRLMQGCKFSLVESFHGIIFSYIFRKNFWYVENRNIENLDDRIDSILTLFNKKDRIMYTYFIRKENLLIDYDCDEVNLKKMITASKEYLKSVL